MQLRVSILSFGSFLSWIDFIGTLIILYFCFIGTVLGNRVLSEYFNWRYGVFYSTGGDASLLQILQAAFPKPVRRLVQLIVQVCVICVCVQI